MYAMTDRSFTDVLEDIVGNVQHIIRSEVRLAKTEIQEETVKAGKAARTAGSGAVLALYAVGFLLPTCFFALELAVAPWLAALILTLVVGAVAGVLIKLGIKGMKRVNPRPDRTIDTLRENVEWVKNQAK
jgi:VIT1/CCC1 family predicted Fe2+/Mn2+ transporter